MLPSFPGFGPPQVSFFGSCGKSFGVCMKQKFWFKFLTSGLNLGPGSLIATNVHLSSSNPASSVLVFLLSSFPPLFPGGPFFVASLLSVCVYIHFLCLFLIVCIRALPSSIILITSFALCFIQLIFSFHLHSTFQKPSIFSSPLLSCSMSLLHTAPHIVSCSDSCFNSDSCSVSSNLISYEFIVKFNSWII